MTKKETILAYVMAIDICLMIICIIRALVIGHYGPAVLDVGTIFACVFVIRRINFMVERRDREFHEWQKTWFTKLT